MEVIRLQSEWLPQIHEIELVSFPKPWSLKLLSDEFEKLYSRILGAVETQKNSAPRLSGYTVLNIIGPELHLLSLAVAPKARRNGIGGLLLKQTVALAQEEGLSVIYLEVRAGNTAARSLYEQYGFQQIGIRRGYYSDNGEDAILYSHALRSST